MNKTFKRAVSSVLASAMAFSSVTVATVSTTLPFTAVQAFAETSTVASWKYSDATIPAEFGAEAALSSIGNSQTIKTSATTTFSDGFVTVAGTTANDANSCVSAVATDNTGAVKGVKYCVFTPKATGNLNLYVINSGSKTTKAGSIRVYNNLTKNADGTTYAIPSDYTQYDVHGYLEGAAVSPVSIPVTKDTPVCVYFGNSKTILLGMTLVGEAGGSDTTTTTTNATTTTEASTETTTAATETTTVTTTTEGSTEATTAAANWQIKADTAPAEGYADGELIFENEYAAVYAAQKISVQGKPLTVNGRTYEKGFKTNGVNTVIDATSFRLAFKVVAKQSTRVSADTSGGSKNSIFSYDETTGTYTNLTGLVAQNETMFADLDAGTVAYIGNGGTNNSMLAVDIQKGPTPVQVTTKITLGNAATTIPANATVTIGDKTVTADENGNVVFDGKTSTSYKVSYVADGVRYESTLSIGDDGTVTSTLNLPQVSGDATITVKTANGSVVANKKVTLTYYIGAKPVFYTATTDENGVATFANLGFNTYNVSIAGYDTTTAFSPVEGNISLTIDNATAKAYPALPSNASSDNLYVGYAPSSTISTYDSVQDAVDAATAGQTIYVAAGTYNEMVTITKDIKIVGNSANDTIITYNDSQSGNDSTAPNGATTKTKFHGDTVAINGSVNVEFENIQIKNTAEADLGVAQNATALSAYGDNLAATVKLTNCTIWATRDTIFTGKVNANNTWTFDNCLIAGFQDVVCGTGDVTLNDCTWELSLSSDARFLVPNSSSTVTTKMVANNLTIVDGTTTGFTAKTYLGRGWGTSGCSLASTQVIVNGYTDNSGTLITDGVYHGYDTSLANNDGTTLADTNWLVRAKQNENYYTTNKNIDTVAINTLQTPVTKDEDGDYLFKGIVDSALVKDANVSYIGFAVFNADGTFVGNTKNDTVYHVTGEPEDTLYTVNYFKNMPTDGCTVKGFVQYDGVNIMNEVSNQTVTAE